MARTRVIRTDSDFASMIEQGRIIWQKSNGKRISTTTYTGYLASMMRPMISMANIDKEVRGKRQKRP